MDDADPLMAAQRAALIGISTLRTALDLAEAIVADRDRFERAVGRGKGVAEGLFADLARLFGAVGAEGMSHARHEPAEAERAGAADRPAAPAPAKRRPTRKAAPPKAATSEVPRAAKRTPARKPRKSS